jgi:riboflavin synthase
MFTGIIETIGTIKDVTINGTNKTFWVAAAITNELKVDQSVAHNGVCLTVEAINDNVYCLTAIDETLKKTNLHYWQVGTVVNIERCMQMNGRLDGHIVQGHVDSTAVCKKIIEKNGSWEYDFEIDVKFAKLIIEKGSIAVNGISLTLFNVTNNGFTVGVIPYTYNHTNMQYVQVNDTVNIEFDIIGKYVARSIAV